MFRSLGIGGKLSIGFGVLVGITLLIAGLGFVADLTAVGNISRTEELRGPILLAATETQASLLKAQLYMRGYLVLGRADDAALYEVSRKDFEKHLNILKPMLAKSNSGQDEKNIAELDVIYQEWANLPSRLFTLHDNPLENRLALQLSRVEVQPLRTQVLNEINNLLEERGHKEQQQSSGRRPFPDNLARFQTAFDAMVGDVAAFAASGEKSFKLAYGTHAAASDIAWDQVFAQRPSLSPDQRAKLDLVGHRRTEVAELAKKIFAIMESDHAYEDLYLYRMQAVPQAERMIALFGEITKHQKELFSQDLHHARYSLETARIQTLSGGLIAVVIGIATALLLWSNIVGTLRRLTGVAEKIADGDLSKRAKVESGDEIGMLATAINTMTQHLSETIGNLEAAFAESQQAKAQAEEANIKLRMAQSELVGTARRAGMGEIASNVLHNVGNVLNSVNVSANLVNSKMRESKARGLVKAVRLMDEHAADLGQFLTQDDKGKLLPAYLSKAVTALAAEQRGIVDELESLTKSVDHIKDIVAMQQSHAGASSVVEPVQIRDLLEDALRMNATALARHQVVVVREFADLPALLLDKPRLLQILVNLIGNANQAMATALERRPQMTLRAEIAGGAAACCLRIRVEDEGEGIAPENLARIFAHGFTTRKEGHGFGLHSCVLAAQAMGGTLIAHSAGTGTGATFTLELPIKPLEEMHEYF
jgi:signal transduction histidine kinase